MFWKRTTLLLTLFCFTVEFITAQCNLGFVGGDIDTICGGSSPQELPEGIPAGGTYVSDYVDGNFFIPTGLEPGTYYLPYIVDNPDCAGSVQLTVIIPPPDTLDITGAFDICPGQGARIYTDRVRVTWADGSKDSMHTFTPLYDTTSYFSFSDSFGCMNTQYFTIDVHNINPNVSISGGGFVCAGSSLYLVFENGVDEYPIWPDSTTSPFYYIPSAYADTLEVPVLNDFGCDTTLFVEINAEIGASLQIAGDSILCLGDSLLLSFSGGEKYYVNGALIPGNTYEVLLTESGYLSISSQLGSGCQYYHTLPVIVYPRPQLAVSDYTDVCYGEYTSISIDGSNFYQWITLPDSTLNYLYAPSPEDSTVVAFAGELYEDLHVLARALNDYGCYSEQEIWIHADPLPDIQVVPLTPYCENRIIHISATGADYFNWFDGSESIDASSVSYFGYAPKEYRIIGQNITGCIDTIFFMAPIYPVPTIDVIGDAIICQGYPATLTATGAATYEWDNALSGDTVQVYPMYDGNVLAVGASEFGCKDSLEFFIQVLPAPVLSIASDDTELCFGDTTEIALSSDSPFEWQDGSLENTFIIAPAADTLLIVSALTADGCDKSDSLLVRVYPLPVISLNGVAEICEGESVVITASGAQSYQWAMGSVESEIQTTPVIPTSYTVTGFSPEGCQNQATWVVNVHPVPYAYFAFNIDTVCDLGPAVSWIANPAGGVMTGDGVINNAFNPGLAQNGINTVTYTITNQFGCTAEDSDVILVDDCSGVLDVSAVTPLVYPNPADDIVHISGLPSGSSMELWSASGQRVWSGQWQAGQSLSLQGFASGIYTMRYSHSQSTGSIRLIKR